MCVGFRCGGTEGLSLPSQCRLPHVPVQSSPTLLSLLGLLSVRVRQRKGTDTHNKHTHCSLYDELSKCNCVNDLTADHVLTPPLCCVFQDSDSTPCPGRPPALPPYTLQSLGMTLPLGLALGKPGINQQHLIMSPGSQVQNLATTDLCVVRDGRV